MLPYMARNVGNAPCPLCVETKMVLFIHLITVATCVMSWWDMFPFSVGICLILYDYIQGRQHSTTRGCFKLPQSYDWLAAVASNWMDFTSRLPSMSRISMLSIITIHQTQIQSFLHTRTVCYHIWQGLLACNAPCPLCVENQNDTLYLITIATCVMSWWDMFPFSVTRALHSSHRWLHTLLLLPGLSSVLETYHV